MTTQHDKAKPWRPWQFSIRTLLLLMLVVGSYLGGWMSNEWQRQRELERARTDSEHFLSIEQMKSMEGAAALPIEIPNDSLPPRRYDLIDDLPK
jgi:hypothetical protein